MIQGDILQKKKKKIQNFLQKGLLYFLKKSQKYYH